MRTTDNNCGKPVSELYGSDDNEGESIDDLRVIANKKLRDIRSDNCQNLLFFPPNWQLGVDANNRIFELGEEDDKYVLTTNNIMGFIGYNKTMLTISSRFYPNGDDYFLHYMLCKVLGINVVNLNFSEGKGDIHDFLPYLFPSYLQNALSQGLYKEYKRNQYNDANVRGAIDVNRHIKINIPFTGKIAYTTREYSYDNPVTQLIRHTVEHLRTREYWHGILAGNAETKANVSQIEYATPSYRKNDLQKIIKTNLKPVNHPYFTKYRELQKLCLQILRREKTIFGSEKNQIHGLLFDGAWLWEEYVNTLVSDKFWHPRNKDKTDMQYLFNNSQGNRHGEVYPDFISKAKDSSNRVIMDAKYKPVDNIYGDDYLQLLAYMYRFDSKRGYYIYPNESGKNTIETYKLLRGVNIKDEKESCGERSGNENDPQIDVIKIGLGIPQKSKPFNQFKDSIKKFEEELKSQIII